MKKYTVLLALAVSLLLVQAAAADLVTNGGFETGTFAGWTQSGDPDPLWTKVVPPPPSWLSQVHSGVKAAYLGAFAEPGYIAQDIDTTPGTYYTLRFWLRNNSDGQITTPNQFLVDWNGANIATYTDLPAFSYTEYVFTPLLATASATELKFGFIHDPAQFLLDDISVNASEIPVPVPGTVVLLGSGLLSLLGWRRLRKS